MIRYSDEDLQHFKTIVQNKIDNCQQQLNLSKEAIIVNSENSRFNSLEETEELSNFNLQMMLKHKQKLEELKMAMVRIENKSYGICRKTGSLIDRKRLELIPETKFNIK